MPTPCLRRAVVWSGGDTRMSFMVQLAVRTLAAGLRASGFVVTLGSGARRLHATSSSGALADLRDSRDLFVWVGIYDHILGIRDAKSLRARGVLTAFYSTESHEIWDKNCTVITALPVTEIWQYTHSNVARCPAQRVGKPVRYVPPGYLPRERMAAADDPRRSTLPQMQLRVLFLGGNRPAYDKRRRCLNMVSQGLLESATARAQKASHRCTAETHVSVSGRYTACPLQFASDAYDDAAWDRYVAFAPYFLNVHKACNATASTSTAACESFRLSLLLAAGGIVFSEHCHPDDEAMYDGLVTFGDIGSLSSTILAVHATDAAAGDHGAARRATRRAAFEARFAPAVLFERAGLTALFATQSQRCGDE